KGIVKGIIKSVGEDKSKWNAHIKSGIPLQSDLLLEENIDIIIGLLEDYFLLGEVDIQQKINLLTEIENLINHIPVLSDTALENERLHEIRTLWLMGESMTRIKKIENAQNIIGEHYMFKLPWVLNGIAKKLANLDLDVYSELLQELSILSETGLPNLVAVKIYQAGIRSRESAIEMSSAFREDSWDKGIKFYKNKIIENADLYKILFSESTASWIDLFLTYNQNEVKTINNIEPFEINSVDVSESTILIPKSISRKQYLVSSDLKTIIPVKDIEGLYVTEVIDEDGVYFEKGENDLWELVVVNPNIHLNLIDDEIDFA
ncbi:MAG: hypothetical protein KDD03_05535, partial [Gelidibacter sp.]|nr:hypothetical protein [Gelidibacter sp.]